MNRSSGKTHLGNRLSKLFDKYLDVVDLDNINETLSERYSRPEALQKTRQNILQKIKQSRKKYILFTGVSSTYYNKSDFFKNIKTQCVFVRIWYNVPAEKNIVRHMIRILGLEQNLTPYMEAFVKLKLESQIPDYNKESKKVDKFIPSVAEEFVQMFKKKIRRRSLRNAAGIIMQYFSEVAYNLRSQKTRNISVYLLAKYKKVSGLTKNSMEVMGEEDIINYMSTTVKKFRTIRNTFKSRHCKITCKKSTSF